MNQGKWYRWVAMRLPSGARPLTASKPRDWQVLLALLVGSVLSSLLSNALTWYKVLPFYEDTGDEWAYDIGPPLLLAPVVVVAWLLGRYRAQRIAMVIFMSILTMTLLSSVAGMVGTLGWRSGESAGFQLLGDAVVVWLANVYVFATWYWILDSGGLAQHSVSDRRADFAFPQQSNHFAGWEGWRPDYVDYLFLAFNASTSFSPSDTLVLSRRAKLLMMGQSLLSLIILAMLAARAINILR